MIVEHRPQIQAVFRGSRSTIMVGARGVLATITAGLPTAG